MNNYGMNNDNMNTSGRAEGQDNPAHSHNFSLQRYVADAERNAYLRRPIVRLPEERPPQTTEIPPQPPQQQDQPEVRRQRNVNTQEQNNERPKQPPVRRPREDDYIPEPPLGFYPLAGRTTYIGSHKRQAKKKLIIIIAAVVIIALAFIILNFGDSILSFIRNVIAGKDTARTFFGAAISDTYIL